MSHLTNSFNFDAALFLSKKLQGLFHTANERILSFSASNIHTINDSDYELTIKMLGHKGITAQCAKHFSGTVETIPEIIDAGLTRGIASIKINRRLEDEPIIVIPISKEANLFTPVYSSPQELLDEVMTTPFVKFIQDYCHDLIPSNFNWAKHICRINGSEWF